MKLANDQDASFDIKDRPVHLAFTILENSKLRTFLGQIVGFGLAITHGNAEENQQSVANLADDVPAHADMRFCNALQ